MNKAQRPINALFRLVLAALLGVQAVILSGASAASGGSSVILSGASAVEGLPTGQRITPLAAPGAQLTRLATGLREDGNADASGAMSLSLSPDGATLLALTSGFNADYYYPDGREIRFPVRDPHAMSFKHRFGNLVLSMAMSLLFFHWVSDSQSGMWVFRRSILKQMKLESDGMAFSEEIKIEAFKDRGIRFAELSILYTSRLGEMKLNPWRDGCYNLWFLIKKRFS